LWKLKLKDVADFAAKVETAQQFNILTPSRCGKESYSAELQSEDYNHLNTNYHRYYEGMCCST